MPKCTICSHPQGETIDKLLLQGQSFRVVANQFGVTFSSLQRHFSTHLREAWLSTQQKKGDRLHGILEAQEDLLLEVQGYYRDRLRTISTKTTDTGIACAGEIRRFGLAIKPLMDVRTKLQDGQRTATLRAYLEKLEQLVEESFDNDQKLLLKDLMKEALRYAETD